MEKNEWKARTEAQKCQKFYDHWYTCSGDNLINAFPYLLSLGVNEHGASLLPFRPISTSRNQIVVTKSYDDMLHRLLHLRMKDTGDVRGAVITGQPGVGAYYNWIPTPCNSPAHPFSRKNYLPKVHARIAAFSSPGRTPVRQLCYLPFLPRPSIRTIGGVRLRGSPYAPWDTV